VDRFSICGDERFIDNTSGNRPERYDDTLAQYAEAIPPLPREPISLLTLIACVLLPGGLFVLTGLLLWRHFRK
jgi:hypothetical protein